MTRKAHAARSLDDGPRLAALSVGQIVSWGILYYAPIVAAPAISAETGWSLVQITLSLSAGLIASAVAGVPVGRWLDKHGPRSIMSAGSLFGAAGMLLATAAPSLPQFVLGWLIAGISQSAVLYQAAFTVITRRHERDRRRAMTILTLAGGLASTIFAPVVAGLLSITDWRSTLAILAIALVVITTPLHWWTLERAWAAATSRSVQVHTIRSVLGTRQFWTLEAAMIGIAVALYSVTLALIPLLTEKGLSYELAAWAFGLLGAGQVAGRLLYIAIPHAAAPWVPLLLVALAGALTLAALAVLPGPPWLLILVGVAAGAVRGAQTLVQGSAVAERWGASNYGAINGVFAAPITAVAALGPSLGPLLVLGTGSYAAMALIAAGVAGAAALAARWS